MKKAASNRPFVTCTSELSLNNIPHEIVVVDDGSTDRTWQILTDLSKEIPALRPTRNTGANGFGRAVVWGLNHAQADGIVVMMADNSDDCQDVVRYWQKLNEGYDCVFGSRFIKGRRSNRLPNSQTDS